MSHTSVASSSLGSISEALFKKALEIVAQKYGGEVADHFEDYYGNKSISYEGCSVIGAIKTPSVKRGIGAIVKNGELKFVGDSYGCEKKFKELQKEIEKTYRNLCLAIAFEENAWDIEDVLDLDVGTVFNVEKS